MAIYDQISRHGGWLDITCYNSGSEAITAGLWVQGDTGTSPVYPNVKAIHHDDTVTCLAGVAVENIAVGGFGRICVHGPAVTLAGGTVTQFMLVQTLLDGAANDGKTLAIDRTVTQEALPIGGFALTPGDVGDYVEVFVNVVPATTAA